MDLARREGADAILRGIRDASDLPLEMQMATANRAIGGLDTVFLVCSPLYSLLSSSIVRDCARHGAPIEAWSPNRSSTTFTRRASRRRIQKSVCKMERDQERFYEMSWNPARIPVAEQETDEVDDLKFFLELLKLIRMAINAGANVPLTNKRSSTTPISACAIDDMEKTSPTRCSTA